MLKFFNKRRGLLTLTLITIAESLPGQLLNKNNIGIEITASILPKATITRIEGNYRLQSHLQSAYDLGINYIRNLKENLVISSGFHVTIGKMNFFANIPDRDLIRYNINGKLLIEDKETWGAIRIPLTIEKKVVAKRLGAISIKTGMSLRYSGFMPEDLIRGSIVESNGQVTNIFDSDFSGKNMGKPWITILAGLSKPITLDNRNIVTVGLNADISTAYFFKGNYSITIPGQPVTSGTYKISGSSLSLSVCYIFTGTNKKLVRSYQQ
jgi:hypothetical protein